MRLPKRRPLGLAVAGFLLVVVGFGVAGKQLQCSTGPTHQATKSTKRAAATAAVGATSSTTTVVVVVQPKPEDAIVFDRRSEERIGQGTVAIEFASQRADSRSLRVERQGYHSREISVHPTDQDTVEVQLQEIVEQRPTKTKNQETQTRLPFFE